MFFKIYIIVHVLFGVILESMAIIIVILLFQNEYFIAGTILLLQIHFIWLMKYDVIPQKT